MRLLRFRVTDFRSIQDSGDVDVLDRTALVGRNESGKSSLLIALHGLKPGGVGMPEFTLARDFPRDRARSEFSKDITILTTRWSLDAADKKALGDAWPRASSVSEVVVRRPYANTYQVEFINLSGPEQYSQSAAGAIAHLRTVASKAGDKATSVSEACDKLTEIVTLTTDQTQWMQACEGKLNELSAAFGENASQQDAKSAFTSLRNALTAPSADKTQEAAARTLVYQRLPTFVYLDEWDELHGHHDIDQYVARAGQTSKEDGLFAKLLKVAELNANELQKHLNAQHEERTLLTDRASRVFTKVLREFWTDRKISVRFTLDGKHFDVHVSDEETDALVQLDQRSRGFRWYFSFYVTFAADTKGGDKEKAILLLDEPGLFLHAAAQRDLLKYFRALMNQVLYSTHSPFMISTDELHSVRTVNLSTDGKGTTVSGNPSGDATTLFPLQAALGYDLSQTLFVGQKNLVVEGVTDFWFLSSISEALRTKNGSAIDTDVVLTPAGGSSKVPFMVALLSSQRLTTAALLDSESGADRIVDELVKNKLARPKTIVRVLDAFGAGAPSEADIEDLLDPAVYIDLVKRTYAKELGKNTLALDAKIPRIVRRVEAAFTALGLQFNKTRPASLLMRTLPAETDTLLSGGALERFEKLFQLLNAAVAASDPSKPFS